MKKRHLPLLIGLLGLCTAFAPLRTEAAEIVIKAAHTIAVGNAREVPWAKFKEFAEAKSNGRIEVQLYPNSALGNDNELLEKTQMGAIQIGFCSSSNLTTTVADWAVFDLPYIFSKTNANQTLFYDKDGNLGGPIFDRLNKQMLKKNIKLLWISPAAFRGIGVNKAGVKTLNDIKGMKIRCTASDVERDAIAAFGANPVAMGFGEIYTALQQKTLDGESLPPDLMYDSKHNEVIKSVLANRFNGFFTIANMNASFYNNLPDWAKKVVDEAAHDAIAYTNAHWDELLNERVEKMKASGVEVHDPTEEELKEWKKATQPIIDEYIKKNGTEWYNTVLNASK